MTHQELKEGVKQALKNREEVRLLVLRGLLAAATNELVSKGRKPTEELSEEELLALVRRAAKQRKDSIEQFSKGGREDLSTKEREELGILESLLPPEMPREEVEKLVRQKAAAMGISDKAKAGQLMGAVMKELKGKADGAVVKDAVEKLFS
ncbi:MAG: GatB/YqeY domain-containing protein [Patescibacteria group bacterium]|nr:GatB/YqeY domain-containing protein [Patescibacteria group bacterium]